MARRMANRGSGHDFSTIPRAEIPRSSFDQTHTLTTAFDSGYLVPIYCDEALPGDTHSVAFNTFIRMVAPQYPVMHRIWCDTFWFAVPLRLLWDNFEKFMGAQDNPGDSTDFLVPQVDPPTGGWPTGSLGDFLGIPVGVETSVAAWWHRAYALTWNTWFRDQSLQDSVTFNTGDGPDPASDYENYGASGSDPLLRRGKRHDYFTSSLVAPQKGAAVELPLGTSAPVVEAAPFSVPTFTANSGAVTGIVIESSAPGGGGTPVPADLDPASGGFGGGQELEWENPGLIADLTTATAATINQLRQAFQLQKLQERDMRGGTRYTEIVRSHFNVISPDQRLQRPEYLGSSSQEINIHPVTQNILLGPTPMGTQGAFGTSFHPARGWTKSFTEHSVILGLACIRADLTYQQGLPRMFSRQTKYDFFWPALGHIGEQAVLSKEIYADGTAADDDVWGYQGRYDEYRYKPSRISGQMRSSATTGTPLDKWHLGLNFASRPSLNAEFIEEHPPVDRVISVPEDVEFYFDAEFRAKLVRPMSMNAIPGLIDHF